MFCGQIQIRLRLAGLYISRLKKFPRRGFGGRKWALAGGFASATIFPTAQNKGKKKMNTETPKAGNTIWAFDLGKGSIGEAVRCGDKFLHKGSLLIPAEFAETKTASSQLVSQ